MDKNRACSRAGGSPAIVPSPELVLVRQGLDPHGTRFGIAHFTAEVIAALDQGA